MAYLWMFGGIYYRHHWENQCKEPWNDPGPLPEYPPVTILVPCHNEGDNVKDTVAFLAAQHYPNFEIIAVNDGSTDNTGELLDELAQEYESLRVVHLAGNQGKAMALNVGALMTRNNILICIDGDALLDTYATHWLVRQFLTAPRLGAVTGNPRIRNRTSLLGKIQVGEFSSIIGLIKRAQRIYGRIFTVSGVVVAFNKTALHDIGYWTADNVTEDIDVSWRLQLNHWDVRFEPNALCWILTPETLKGLTQQRIRWAQGGAETFFRYLGKMLSWRRRRMWLICIEYIVSIAWSYSLVLTLVLWVTGKLVDLPDYLQISTLMPKWPGVILGLTCLLQASVSLVIDSRYEKGLFKYFFWMVWYPLAYWMINVVATVQGFPKALVKKRGERAVWISPDRGIQSLPKD
jgi:biofilm PGA synthesis N-glycosyltransferase PgaC